MTAQASEAGEHRCMRLSTEYILVCTRDADIHQKEERKDFRKILSFRDKDSENVDDIQVTLFITHLNDRGRDPQTVPSQKKKHARKK